jgi:hypothetical protein
LIPGDFGVCEICPAQVGAAQVGVAEKGAGKRGAHEASVAEVRFLQMGSAQVCHFQVGLAEVRAIQLGLCKVRVLQEVLAPELEAAQARVLEADDRWPIPVPAWISSVSLKNLNTLFWRSGPKASSTTSVLARASLLTSLSSVAP